MNCILVKTVFPLLDLNDVADKFFNDVIAWIADQTTLIPSTMLENRLINTVWDSFIRKWEEQGEINCDKVRV